MIKKKAVINTPLGCAILEGNTTGISSFKLTEEEIPTTATPAPELKEAIDQLELYFTGELKEFNLKLNPEGTDFQKKV